jgi:hypothetical protein
MDKVPFALIRWYTLLQLLCVIVIFVVATFTGVVANVFPVLLAALVLIRRYLLPTLFPDRDLKCLDRDGDETEADLGINVHQNSIRQSLEASILTRSSPRNTHSYGGARHAPLVPISLLGPAIHLSARARRCSRPRDRAWLPPYIYARLPPMLGCRL